MVMGLFVCLSVNELSFPSSYLQAQSLLSPAPSVCFHTCPSEHKIVWLWGLIFVSDEDVKLQNIFS